MPGFTARARFSPHATCRPKTQSYLPFPFLLTAVIERLLEVEPSGFDVVSQLRCSHTLGQMLAEQLRRCPCRRIASFRDQREVPQLLIACG